MKTPHLFQLKSLILILSTLFTLEAHAQTSTAPLAHQEVNTVHVHGKNQRIQRQTTERLNRTTIAQEMMRDSKDLVRYSADVGVADDGRRTKGFAMRGVEDNRVGVSIDGVALPDSEENSLYARYGNFNNSRLSIDPELVRSVELTKGSDSVHSGSGALGGNVNYRTLNATDLVAADRQWGGMMKHAYNTQNREWVNTVGFGWVNDHIDAALAYSHRRGHETKSNQPNTELYRPSRYTTDEEAKRLAELGSGRTSPDPSAHRKHSYLAKFAWNITPEHRVGVSLTGQKDNNAIKEHSYSLTTYWRNADDVQKRHNTNLYYLWQPENTPFQQIRADLDWQKTENGTLNHKGDYVQEGNWRTGYTYKKGGQTERDFRNFKSELKRLSLNTELKPIQLGQTSHQLTLKLSAGERQFENRNQDLDLDSKTGEIKNTDVYTIQYPIKSKQYGVSFSNNMTLHPNLSAYLAARYDDERVQPQTLSLPCGGQSGFGRLCADANPKGARFRQWSGALGLDWRFTDGWHIAYQASTGHRTPSASEMYFTFESPYGNWLANPNLKSERALTQTISLKGKNHTGNLDVNLYQSRYKDFLFEQESTLTREDPTCDAFAAYYTKCTGKRTDYFQQMVNLDKAKISGLEVKGSLNLNPNWQASGSLAYSKGKVLGEQELSLLSVQPLKMVLGLDYRAPSGKWGLFSRLNFQAAKKPKDAQIAELRDGCRRYRMDAWSGREECVKGEEYTYSEVLPFRWLNKKSWTFDLFGYYQPVKNMTLRAGVFNLFNTRYHTWDSLRGINARSTINTLSVSRPELAAQGLQRYYAPPRNYAVSLEYRF